MIPEENVEIYDMFLLSDTKPTIGEVSISRDQYLDLFEKQFEEDKVLCVSGVEGVGLSTALAMFAQRHRENCVSYFYNGWSRHLLASQSIVFSMLKQLSYYTNSNLNPSETEISFSQCVYKLSKISKKKNKYLYFVFDGFNKIPIEYIDSIRTILAPLFSIDNSRFLFSGTVEEIKQLLPNNISSRQSNEMLRFQLNDVQGYLSHIVKDLSVESVSIIYELSGNGLARRLAVLSEKLTQYGMPYIKRYYEEMREDLYGDDLVWIEDHSDNNVRLLLALLTYSECPMCPDFIGKILKLSSAETNSILEICKAYVVKQDDFVFIRSDNFRKYLFVKLSEYKTNIELRLIDLIERSGDVDEQFVYLPPLYKHVKNNRSLVDYLTSDNVQHYLEKKKSQAALNEQCEYGYNACNDFETQAAAYFRFAINRSVSREIEKNGLADEEIEALISIGEDEKAFALTQNVFLIEERLKCLLIIAQAGKHLSEAMCEQIDSQITDLADAIDYIHIPDKALELAKLMMPIKLEKALSIIDKVAKITKDQRQIDRLYTSISLAYNNELINGEGHTQKSDIVSTKIVDEELRKMATVMKSIMTESTADQVIDKMKELPNTGSQLYFLRYWIPDHKNSNDIGSAVEYAVKLVIDTSTVTMPKVTFLRSFCVPLPDMAKSQIQNVVSLLDAVTINIKYPTIEYVSLMTLIIRAVGKYDKENAKNRLQTLYLEILDLKDLALQAHCKALLLRDFDCLGEKIDIEKWLMPSFKLQKEILKDLMTLLDSSAFHLKVVEGPIKALVCVAPSFVKDIIENINTAERRDKAYLLAATEYVRQTEIQKFDWDYFLQLYTKISYNKSEIYRPLYELVNKLIEVVGDTPALLSDVKKHYDLFKKIEQPELICYFLSNLYVWISNNYSDEGFLDTLKKDLELAWSKINVPWLKVNTGYNIAKVLSKISMKSEAKEYVEKTTAIRQKQWLPSQSCVVAYNESLTLYTHSLGVLIRAGLCEDDDIDQFKTLLNYDDNEEDTIILWSRIALEYYGVGDFERFEKIMSNYVSKQIEHYSIESQKRILYHISPSLYLSSTTVFYSRIENFDVYFRSACISNIARYIQTKYPYPEYTGSNVGESQIPLEKKDYDNLLDLVEHSEDDFFVFELSDALTKAIEENIGSKLSREIQRVLFDKLEKIVNEKLPIAGGIQHNGYLIACMAMIKGRKMGSSIEAAVLKSEIESIPNKADQAFLYAHVAEYLKRASEKAEFINLAVQKTEELEYVFDKFNRYSYCIEQAFKVASPRAKIIVTRVMNTLKGENNGTYSYYQGLLDVVREHDEQLADSMLEMMDDDPSRVQYKAILKQRIQSDKKIDAAKNDLLQIQRLNNNEQTRFFERQMECLIKRKNVVRNVNSTQSIIAAIYNRPISDTRSAALYFLENLYQKNCVNGRYKALLRNLHLSILYNVKLVLALASGTREKMERVGRILNERSDRNQNMIQVGEAKKGIDKIVKWYEEHPYDILRIIDPYFSAEDLPVLKALMDINNGLKCYILTNNTQAESLNDIFQRGWNHISDELPGRIEVKSCSYEDNPKSAPWHDRWWILYDGEDSSEGLRLASISTFGKRISEISGMDVKAIESAMHVFTRYFVNMMPRSEGRKLKYEETKLR